MRTYIMVSVRLIESLMIFKQSLAVKAMHNVDKRPRYNILVTKLLNETIYI